MMQITISDGTTTITMPRTKKVTDAGEWEYDEIKMASKKVVREMTGFRIGFTYEWDYVQASLIATLKTLLRAKTFFTVTYFDIDGATGSGTFSVSYPAPEVFKFKNGIAMWHNFKLTIKAQEVS